MWVTQTVRKKCVICESTLLHVYFSYFFCTESSEEEKDHNWRTYMFTFFSWLVPQDPNFWCKRDQRSQHWNQNQKQDNYNMSEWDTEVECVHATFRYFWSQYWIQNWFQNKLFGTFIIDQDIEVLILCFLSLNSRYIYDKMRQLYQNITRKKLQSHKIVHTNVYI